RSLLWRAAGVTARPTNSRSQNAPRCSQLATNTCAMRCEFFNPNGSLQLATLPLNGPGRFLSVGRLASAGFCTRVRPARQQIAIGLISPQSNCANLESGSDDS